MVFTYEMYRDSKSYTDYSCDFNYPGLTFNQYLLDHYPRYIQYATYLNDPLDGSEYGFLTLDITFKRDEYQSLFQLEFN